MQVAAFDAKVGKKGHIKARGSLPLTASVAEVATSADDIPAPADSITMDIKYLKLRLHQLYSGPPCSHH